MSEFETKVSIISARGILVYSLYCNPSVRTAFRCRPQQLRDHNQIWQNRIVISDWLREAKEEHWYGTNNVLKSNPKSLAENRETFCGSVCVGDDARKTENHPIINIEWMNHHHQSIIQSSTKKSFHSTDSTRLNHFSRRVAIVIVALGSFSHFALAHNKSWSPVPQVHEVWIFLSYSSSPSSHVFSRHAEQNC